MRLTRETLLQKVQESPMIPVFNHEDKETAVEVVKACYRGGARLFEWTNRSDEAIDVFKHILSKQNEYPEMIIGVGTILNVYQARSYYDAGAAFIVSPIVDKEVADFCNNKQLAWVPGCGTLTELTTAEQYGAGLLKVFPADVYGPKFIKGVLGPCGYLKLMPTGGVQPTEESLRSWFEAGVVCVGMGSQLISKQDLKDRNFQKLESDVRNCFELIDKIQG